MRHMRNFFPNDEIKDRLTVLITAAMDFTDFVSNHKLEFIEMSDELDYEEVCDLIDTAVFYNDPVGRLFSKIYEKKLFKENEKI